MNISQWVHFSIDDVIGSLKWVYQNQPESVFEEPMLCKLKEWHEKYEIKCDLYVYEITDGFKLTDLQDRYCKELCEESDWLKFGWHRRKDGELTDDDKTEIESFDRIHIFIREKISSRSWTDILRLHGWEASGELMSHLTGNGIRRLLTADSNRLSYDLTEDDFAILQESGRLWKEPFLYLVTDIQFDCFADSMTVESCLDYTQQFLIKKPYKGLLEVFCHEWKFQEIASDIEQYWESFSKIEYTLYMNASVLVDDYLYFTTCNTNFLFRRCLSSEDAEVVAELPCTTFNAMKFSSLVYFEDSIWMIPWMEKNIVVYDMWNNSIKVFPIPYECEEEPNTFKFRKAVQDGKYLWLLPKKTPLLLRIDMEKRSAHLFEEWPEEVCFSKEEKMNFISMYAAEEYLYLFRYGCSHNICVNLKDGSMKIWEVDVSKEFGIVTDDRLLVSPVHSGSAIRCYGLKVPDKEILYDLPQWVWLQEKIYAFWHSERVGKFVYILPHEANAVIQMDLIDGSINCTNVKIGDYKTLRPNSEFAAYEAFGLGDYVLITPYMGNKAIMIDDKRVISKEVTFFISVSQITKSHIEKSVYYEDDKIGLRYLFGMELCQKAQWIMEKDVPEEIRDIYRSAEQSCGSMIYQEILDK